jgi:cytochrome d ubiquinol oxidase subunit II
MSVDLPLVWAFIIAFAVFAYVVMDGFDLGIGILFPAFGVGAARDQAMNAIAPVWDGNETWLVLGGGGLFAAFPLAYAIVMPATYPLVIAMLLGLVFRGVAFEFRWRDPGHRAFWDLAFSGGSLVAALAQGMILGAILQGVTVEDRSYAGSWFDWLTPYTLLTGLGVVAGYALLGATWLIGKTEDDTQAMARRLARPAAVATLGLMAGVSLYTPFLDAQYFRRWFELPSILFASQVPLLVAIVGYFLFRGLARGREWSPFVLSLALFLLGMIGLGVSMFPFIVPESVTIWEAAAPPKSQSFMLVGVAIILPLILAYTAWAYWVFRGKVGTHGYH